MACRQRRPAFSFSSKMGSLFVGKIPEGFEREDLERAFEKFGKVTRADVKRGPASNFGFVEVYEKAIDFSLKTGKRPKSLSRKWMDLRLTGLSLILLFSARIVVEWAKGRANRGDRDNKCFSCGGEGHWARGML